MKIEVDLVLFNRTHVLRMCHTCVTHVLRMCYACVVNHNSLIIFFA
mgnify:CR=1 FL=1